MDPASIKACEAFCPALSVWECVAPRKSCPRLHWELFFLVNGSCLTLCSCFERLRNWVLWYDTETIYLSVNSCIGCRYLGVVCGGTAGVASMGRDQELSCAEHSWLPWTRCTCSWVPWPSWWYLYEPKVKNLYVLKKGQYAAQQSEEEKSVRPRSKKKGEEMHSIGAEIPVGKAMVEQVFSCSPCRTMPEEILPLQLWRTPHWSRWIKPEGTVQWSTPAGSSLSWRTSACEKDPSCSREKPWRGRSDIMELLWMTTAPHSPPPCRSGWRKLKSLNERIKWSLGRRDGGRCYCLFLTILL